MVFGIQIDILLKKKKNPSKKLNLGRILKMKLPGDFAFLKETL